jgi:hypothetical protein
MSRAWLGWAAAALLAGCGAEHAHGAHDAGADAGTVVGCETDPRVTPWTPGLSFASADGALRVTVSSATPEAPVRGDNAWVVRLTDAAGADLKVTGVTVEPDMPDHGHGAMRVAKATLRADGAWDLRPLAFAMPGVWRVKVAASLEGGARKDAVIHLCLAG